MRTHPWDLAAVLLLLVAAVVSRYRTLDVYQNPDEYSYAATAAYLQAEGQSAFTLPCESTWVNFVYLRFADWFGVYRITPVRCLVLVLCWLTAVLIYAQLSRVANRMAAILASLFFLGYGLTFEGASANREWFAMPPAVLGLLIAARSLSPRAELESASSPRRRWHFLASGGLLAAGYLFKDQTLPLALVVPAVLVFRARVDRDWRERLLDLGAYSACFLSVYLAGLVPYALEGKLGAYFHATFVWLSRYAVESTAHQARDMHEVVELLWGRHFRHLPYRSLLILPYGMTILVLLRALGKMALPRRLWQKETILDSPLAQVGALYCLFAAVAISAGLRFFTHYYLFILPAWCLMLGLALHGLTRAPRNWFAVLMGSLLAFAVWLDIKPYVPLRVHAPRVALGFVAFLSVFYLGHVLVRFRRRLPHPFEFRRAISLASITACYAAIAVSAGMTLRPVPRAFYNGPAVMIGDVVRQLSGPDDRLFVWGWLSEAYAYSHRIPATRYISCNGIVNDIQPRIEACRWDERHGEILLAELEKHRPPVIVDAAWVSFSMSSREAYRITRYPVFAAYLRRHYRIADVRDAAEGKPEAGQIVFYQRLPGSKPL